MKDFKIIFVSLILLSACSGFKVKQESQQDLNIYPDYKEVTIPYNIAPLNFMPEGVEKGAVRFVSSSGESLVAKVRNGRTDIPLRKWRRFLAESKGASLEVTVADKKGTAYKPFNIHVASEAIDKYVAYRLIEPGYELWREMGIYQRDLESFRQTPIVESRNVDNACVNCHNFNSRNPEEMVMHVRGNNAGTYVNVDGEWEKLNTKTPQTISALVYPSWHPGGRYIAFSVNDTKQTFHVSDPDKILVYDFKSDVVVYDIKERRLITDYAIFRKAAFETFPAFSNDGGRLFYCVADSLKMPTGYKNLQYALCSIGFNAEEGEFGQVDTLFKKEDLSVTMPRVSPDGKYVLFTTTAYGNFTVWHKDSELNLLDLNSGEVRNAEEWNSEDSDSFHSWSGNSRWAVFSSRRGDSYYTRLYIGYISEDGTLGKAFLLPQKDPKHNDRLMKSYNIPELVEGKVSPKAYSIRNASEEYQVEFAGRYMPGKIDAATGASQPSVN